MGCFTVRKQNLGGGMTNDEWQAQRCTPFVIRHLFFSVGNRATVVAFSPPLASFAQENFLRKSGCLPHYLKTLNLINYINLFEIVKNFTNFACGIGGKAIRFRRSSNRFVSALVAGV
jgi:hypothetical protein